MSPLDLLRLLEVVMILNLSSNLTLYKEPTLLLLLPHANSNNRNVQNRSPSLSPNVVSPSACYLNQVRKPLNRDWSQNSSQSTEVVYSIRVRYT